MKLRLLILTCFCYSFLNAQVFKKDTLSFKTPGNRINLVYLGDGYQEAQLDTFVMDAKMVNDRLFETTPFREYKDYFNVFAIRVPSVQSGVTHKKTAPDCPQNQAVETVRNFFGSQFDGGNIHRLVVSDSAVKIFSVLAANFPDYTQAVLIANSVYYGGSGGTVATTTKHSNAAQIAIHELGHSFGGLADEYWTGTMGEKPNMTQEWNPEVVKWKRWVGTNQVGVYPFVPGIFWYRPVQNGQCKMEVLGVPFCNVCVEAIIEKIHALVKPIDSYLPLTANIVNPASDLDFRINLVLPKPNTIRVSWLLDGTFVALNTDSVRIRKDQLVKSSHTVKAIVVDSSNLLRSEQHFSAHVHTVQWNINMATGTISPELSAAQVKVFPNPFNGHLNIEYVLDKTAFVKVELYNSQGVKVHTTDKGRQPPGKHLINIPTGRFNLPDGAYHVVFYVNGDRVTEKTLRIGQ